VTSSSAWLYLRGHEAVRIVLDGQSVAVYGPGRSIRRVQFTDEMDAVLYHTAVERSLLTGGWMLDRRLSDSEIPVEASPR
jgi:hypothetical protein